MALGKTISEIRALPYEEFVSWQHFYSLEPWGWHDREYRTAALLTMLVNVNVNKRANQKDVKDFVRDMPRLVEKAYMELEYEEDMREKFRQASKAERARMIAAHFGGMKVKDR